MLLTTGQAAEELGCAVTTYRRLITAGVLPELSRRGVRVMTPLWVVRALQERARPSLNRLNVKEVAVLRIDAARPSEDNRQEPNGYAAGLGPDILLNRLRGWWRCDAASVAAGGVLPVTLSGYVVAVLTGLNRWEKGNGGRHAFPDAVLAGHITDLATPVKHLTALQKTDRDIADLLLGTRLPSQSSGAIAYVSTKSSSAN
ncbi:MULTISPECIES: helix-turn-helix domain-containing protein [Streptomyces]|uniref:helix-turn-helix domain-containing protein n=1 Tax=Streptomyces TaxID=1883 RepID=UPI00103CE806|nr:MULTISPECIES: helix-turn-helix domain-containing protein [Streptomyces]MBT3078351.1 helix-turn-helix domain-containing protein [Streptomyces sp. COG21]MBT3087329.1 helix-turn-helix domain-containing protein [Streptomyces sp. CYG21]MBT3097693.1 helix-turn-helix domain-containing protein [Streptomyces sp. CBG30]MBT3105010.1 helix-turn-helix domain-containing protein [Streptomyces sp. COG19]MDI7790240.1 helix-turn-helix domain-containing protein [Streptomyces cavourensis]